MVLPQWAPGGTGHLMIPTLPVAHPVPGGQGPSRHDRGGGGRVTGHAWATLALEEGIDIHVVSDRLDHDSTQILRPSAE